ncbi:MAG: glycosyltransferase [Verrucomicrobiota bacterium]|nr:glycosyltransferase [Verrucomicrobiota bacterium]
MSDELVIISPEIAAGSGGVADYTLRLVEEWESRVRPRLVLPNEFKSNFRADKILLQYSAYGFDRLGYPGKFLRALIDWKKTARGLLVIMFHEIWAFWPFWNKNWLVQLQHRRHLGKLIALADAVFTSTPSQAEHLRKLVPQCHPQVMPVGSNVRRTVPDDAKRDAGRGIVFGLQSGRIRTLCKFSHLPSVITKVVTFGAQNTSTGDKEESELLQGLRLTSGYEMRGALAEGEVSELLGTAEFALSAQDELSLTKSGTFMACAAHGLNIISPAADSLGAEPVCWLTSPAELINGISPNELNSRAENLRAWQERTSSWPMIAERFAEALRL